MNAMTTIGGRSGLESIMVNNANLPHAKDLPVPANTTGIPFSKLLAMLGRGGARCIWDEFRGEGNDFKAKVEYGVMTESIGENPFGINPELSLRQAGKMYGLEAELQKDLNKNSSGVCGMSQRALYVVGNTKDAIENAMELIELALTGAAAATGAGSIVVQVGANAVQLPINMVTQTAYTAMLAGVGFGPGGLYSRDKEGLTRFAVDAGIGYGVQAAASIPVVGSLVELATNPDDPTQRIVYATHKKTKADLFHRINESLPEGERVDLSYQTPTTREVLKEEAGRLKQRLFNPRMYDVPTDQRRTNRSNPALPDNGADYNAPGLNRRSFNVPPMIEVKPGSRRGVINLEEGIDYNCDMVNPKRQNGDGIIEKLQRITMPHANNTNHYRMAA